MKVLYGQIQLKPLEYRVVGGQVVTKWWKRRCEEWFVVGEFCTIGPLATQWKALALAGFLRLRDPDAMLVDALMKEVYS
jgi:hypothetical protein